MDRVEIAAVRGGHWPKHGSTSHIDTAPSDGNWAGEHGAIQSMCS